MRRRMAHGLMIAILIIGLRAAQDPNNSEASSTPTSPNQQSNNFKQAGKGTPYQEQRPGTGSILKVSPLPAAKVTRCTT
jgi:hypothetical protein